MTQILPLNNSHRLQLAPLNLPTRLLLGPGPANIHPTILESLKTPPVGHLDPAFLGLMDEIQSLLRYTWQTENALTIAVSGTGSAAMEATIANAVEPGDVVLVGICGYFGNRLVDMAGRYGAEVHSISKPWGQVFHPRRAAIGTGNSPTRNPGPGSCRNLHWRTPAFGRSRGSLP